MISRRSVRINVLKAIYCKTIEQDIQNESILKLYKEFNLNISEITTLILAYLKNLIEFVDLEVSSKSKIGEVVKESCLKKSELYRYLNEDAELEFAFKKTKSLKRLDSDIINLLVKETLNFGPYKELEKRDDISQKEFYQFFLEFFKKIFFENKDFIAALEFQFINCNEDIDLVLFAWKKDLKKAIEGNAIKLYTNLDKFHKEMEFAEDLIRLFCLKSDELDTLIEPKLVKWDFDRIPKLQIISIKLAIIELMYFENIPVKVSINEYVDIVKLFCDFKSKVFVNGIIDRIYKDLFSNDQIKKIGRGLD